MSKARNYDGKWMTLFIVSLGAIEAIIIALAQPLPSNRPSEYLSRFTIACFTIILLAAIGAVRTRGKSRKILITEALVALLVGIFCAFFRQLQGLFKFSLIAYFLFAMTFTFSF